MTDIDYYEILGVQVDASFSEIKAAWKTKVSECHPDKFSSMDDKRDAHDRFVQLAEAYRVLGDEESRRLYDGDRLGCRESIYSGYDVADPKQEWNEVVELYNEIWEESTGRFIVNTIWSAVAVLVLGVPFLVMGVIFLVTMVTERSGGDMWILPFLFIGWACATFLGFGMRIKRIVESLRRRKNVMVKVK